jgi:hypothetical protein
MVFPGDNDCVADFNILVGVTKQIADHAHVPGIREFYQDD